MKIKFGILKNSSDFKNLTEKGYRLNTEFFKLIISSINDGDNKIRLGFAIGKKTGKAVVRNTIKRRIKEIFRNINKTGSRSLDILVIVKKEINSLRYEELKSLIMQKVAKYL